jgi:hypothetical protein
MAHINIEFHFVLGLLLAADFVDVRWLPAGRGAGGRLDSLAGRRFCGKGVGGRSADVIQSAPSQAFTTLAKEKRQRPFISHRSTRWTGFSSPVGRPIRTLLGRGSKGRRSSSSAAASLSRCSNMPATRQALILQNSKSSALAVPRKWVRRFGTAKGTIELETHGPSHTAPTG